MMVKLRAMDSEPHGPPSHGLQKDTQAKRQLTWLLIAYVRAQDSYFTARCHMLCKQNRKASANSVGRQWWSASSSLYLQ